MRPIAEEPNANTDDVLEVDVLCVEDEADEEEQAVEQHRLSDLDYGGNVDNGADYEEEQEIEQLRHHLSDHEYDDKGGPTSNGTEYENDDDDEITIHSISSAGTCSTSGGGGSNPNLRRRSPRGSGSGSSSSSRSSRSTGATTSSSNTGRQEENDDKTPLVTNKRSSRMSYSKQLIKMGRDVFSPPRLSFLSPAQLERRRGAAAASFGLSTKKMSDNDGNGGIGSPDGSTARDDGSMASGMSRPGTSTYLGPTELHNICHAATDASFLHTAKFHAMPQSGSNADGINRVGPTKVLSIVQREASIRDAEGRTAMHVLSGNRKLSRSAEDEQQKYDDPSTNGGRMDTVEVASIIDFVVTFLLPANPVAMIEEDNGGQIPFEHGLVEWIRRVHNDEFGLHRTDESNTSLSGNIENSLQQVQNVVNQSLSVSRAALVNVGRSLHFSSGGASSVAAAAAAQVEQQQRLGADGNGQGLGRSSSWTIESSGSTETISPVAADTALSEEGVATPTFDVDVESGAKPSEFSKEEGDKPAAATRGGRKSKSLSAINNNISRKGQKSFQLKSIRRLPMQHTERLFPLHGRLSSHAQLSLLILSAVIDKLEEDAKAVMRSISIRSTTDDSSLHGASRFSVIRSRLIERIASIPNLMKTLLLIDDDMERNRVFELPIVRAAMLSKRAMGTWFTFMLRSEARVVSQRAVMYLGLLSDVSGEFRSQQLAATGRSSTSSTKPDEIREAVLVLEDLIPSLVGLDEAAVEQAATTPIIRKVLDTMITRPFAVSVMFFDGLFLLLLIWSFRQSADGFVEGESPVTVIKWIYVANANIFYFIIRELGKAVSLALVTRRAFWLRFFWSFWNIVDIFSILFSLGSTVFLRVQFSDEISLGEESRALRWCLSVTTGLLWLKVLGYLKTINMQLATFVLAVIQITKDLAWFLLILFAVVVSFSQMFYTLLLPEECANDEDAAVEERPVCKPSEYYLSVYSILLGDYGEFNREDFHTPFSVFLVVLFSFMVVIVLLNVLIAIVSDSYEKCLIRSQFLFGRARVMILAELISFQNLLRKDSNPQYDHSQWNVCRRIWMRQRSKGWSRGSLIFFALSASVVIIWFIGEMVGYAAGEHYGQIAFSLGSILVNVSVLLIIVAFLSQGTSGMTDASSDDALRGCTSCWYRNSIQRCMVRLLGTSESSSFEKDYDSDSWRGRAIYIQREMTRITAESRAQIKAETKALEGQIYSEVGSLERRVLESEAAVMSEIKASERRIETILRDVVLALGDKGKIVEDSTLLRASV